MSEMTQIRARIALDKEDGWILGVCAGVANYVNLDPALIRVTAIVAALFMPKVMIASYLVAWLIMDEKLTRR